MLTELGTIVIRESSIVRQNCWAPVDLNQAGYLRRKHDYGLLNVKVKHQIPTAGVPTELVHRNKCL